jgi:hypothetical protein
MPPIAMGYSVLGIVIAIAMLDGPPVPLSKLLPAAWSLANELSAIPGMGAVRVAPLIDFPEYSPDISADGSTIHILVGRNT